MNPFRPVTARLHPRALPLLLALPLGLAWYSACSSDNSGSPAGTGADSSVDSVVPAPDATGASDAGAPTDSGLLAEDAPNPFSSDYSDPTMWLCGSHAMHDYCLDVQSATQINPDGSQVDATTPPATSTKLDCFYIYPTVDLTMTAGNRQTFDNIPDILDPLMGQAA